MAAGTVHIDGAEVFARHWHTAEAADLPDPGPTAAPAQWAPSQ